MQAINIKNNTRPKKNTQMKMEKMLSFKTKRGISHLLLLPAAPSVGLMQKPGANDRVHVDRYTLDTGQENCTWTHKKQKKIHFNKCNSH